MLYIVDALQEITSTMGATYWKFNADSCEIEMVGITPQAPAGSDSSVDCECNFENSTVCHVVRMYSIFVLLFDAILLFVSIYIYIYKGLNTCMLVRVYTYSRTKHTS